MASKRYVTVAIDGPAGAGKSTVAKEVAQQLGYSLVDTGALYRAIALLARRQHIAWDDDAGLATIVARLDVSFALEGGENRVCIVGEDVSSAIRTSGMSRGASAVARSGVVRAGLLDVQRRLAGAGAAVLEGRDIGTVVCPRAEVKFFLDASDQVRARRRYDELVSRGESVEFDEVLVELRERDALDRERALSPLKPAADAILLDSTRLPVEQVIKTIVDTARRAENSG